VAEHDDLEFLELGRTKTQDGELQDTPDQQVADRGRARKGLLLR